MCKTKKKRCVRFTSRSCVLFVVEEHVGTLSIPVVRRAGSYGTVAAHFISKGLSATPDLDFIPTNGSVTFVHGQNTSYINVTIVDDADR